MSKLLLTNIGMLATPQGNGPKKGEEQGKIQILKDAWVLVEDGMIAQVGTGAAPAVEGAENPFTDVPADSWYTAPVLWAVEQGITNGMCECIFGS